MRRKKLLSALLLFALLLNGVVPPRTTAHPLLPLGDASTASPDRQFLRGADDGASVLSATSAAVVFEVITPWQQLSLEPVTAGGKQYVRVSLPGWSATAEAGAPALPSLVEEIGAPFGATISVRVTPGLAHTQTLAAPVLPVASEKMERDGPAGAAPLPAPGIVVEEDAMVYTGQAAFPQALAEVTSDGVMREQRIVGVSAFPLQYHPQTRELTVYESLRVEVTFEGALPALRQAPPAESSVYENLLQQNLLNYETARQWRQPAALTSIGTASLPWTPPSPAWRVKVREDGFYKLTYAELNAAGLPVSSLDPRTFRLYNLGSEVAIYVEGEADGGFGVNDYLLFYGQAVASKYTADNVYWLTYGQGTGLRMAAHNAAPGTGATPAFYDAQRHIEQNQYYIPLTPGSESVERWMWDYIYPPSQPSWTHTFSLTAPYAGPATLTVAMLGYLQNAINPDHHAPDLPERDAPG